MQSISHFNCTYWKHKENVAHMHLFPRASFKQVDIPKKDHKAKKILRNGVSLYLPSSFKKTKPKLNKKPHKMQFFFMQWPCSRKVDIKQSIFVWVQFLLPHKYRDILISSQSKNVSGFFPICRLESILDSHFSARK